jgi:hypothetical protein
MAEADHGSGVLGWLWQMLGPEQRGTQ